MAKPALRERYACWIAGQKVETSSLLAVTDKFTGEKVSQVFLAGAEEMETAIAEAARAVTAFQKLSSYERRDLLLKCALLLEKRHEEFAFTLCVEVGKPIRDARTEVSRAIETFKIAAEEATRIRGEVWPLDYSERAKGVVGMWRRFSVGACAFIVPFNFPLNLAAHKVAPAIAVGCPFVMRPATKTPLSALLLGEVLSEAGLPKGSFSIVPSSLEVANAMVEDDRLKLLSFTGSAAVGWDLKKRAGKKKVVLELGGNAACVVDEGADLERAVERITFGAFYQAGQSCISVQRIYVHQKIEKEFREKLVTASKSLKVGDPKDESVAVGPLIAESESARLTQWVGEAVSSGATLLCGGKGKGALFEPTLLTNVKAEAKVSCEEAFGPIAVLESYSDFDSVLARINESRFGLQAGLFLSDYKRMMRAWEKLEVGGVVIGDIPSFRVDAMPYGGVKDSGLGREGVQFAMEEMTELRLLVIHS